MLLNWCREKEKKNLDKLQYFILSQINARNINVISYDTLSFMKKGNVLSEKMSHINRIISFRFHFYKNIIFA